MKILIIFTVALLTWINYPRTAYSLGVANATFLTSDLFNTSEMIRKTRKDLTNVIFNNQVSTSKRRNHPSPNYTLSEFREWMYSQPNFEKLFLDWTMSGNDKMLIPSADRLNDYLPYTLDNLRLVTWRENLEKGYSDMRNGVNNKQSKSVICTHKITGEVLEFYSGSEAERRTGIDNSSISKACLGKLILAGNYKWKFKT